MAPVQPAPSGHDAVVGQSRAPTVLLVKRPPNGSCTRTVQYTALLLMFDCRTIDDLDSESDTRLGLPVATVVVVVVDEVVVVALIEIRARPTTSGWPPTGPKILPNHWPVGASDDIRKRNV